MTIVYTKKKKKKKKFTPHNKILAQDIIDPPKENPKATTVVTSLTLFQVTLWYAKILK